MHSFAGHAARMPSMQTLETKNPLLPARWIDNLVTRQLVCWRSLQVLFFFLSRGGCAVT
jgi:hypothetical protein